MISPTGTTAKAGAFASRAEPGRCVIAGGTVLLPDERLEERDVVIEDGRIRALEPRGSEAAWGDLAAASRVVDATGRVVAPGFVDTHVHGGLGANFMAGSADAAVTISRHLAAGGVTSCLAATASTGPDQLRQSLEGIADVCGPLDDGIEILGIHLEGPFLSDKFRGVHRAEHVRPPDLGELRRLWDTAGPALRLVTLAPELPGGHQAIDFFTSRDVVVSIGHSGADYTETRAAVQAGISRATHVWNGLPALHHRQPGPVLALLESPSVLVELVADGQHVAAEMLHFTIHVVGRDRAMLVSDGTDVAGLPAGRHQRWEGTEVVLSDGVSRTTTGGLAGSVVSMAGAVSFLVERCHVPLGDALVMASATPAASIGAHGKGSLAPGKDADVVVLGRDLSVVETIARGQTIYRKDTTT